MMVRNNFQELCLKKLSDELVQNNLKAIKNETVEYESKFFGEGCYVHGFIDGTGIEFFIYEEEANFIGTNIDLRFEHQDYKTSDELITEFVRSAIKCAKGGKATTKP